MFKDMSSYVWAPLEAQERNTCEGWFFMYYIIERVKTQVRWLWYFVIQIFLFPY